MGSLGVKYKVFRPWAGRSGQSFSLGLPFPLNIRRTVSRFLAMAILSLFNVRKIERAKERRAPILLNVEQRAERFFLFQLKFKFFQISEHA